DEGRRLTTLFWSEPDRCRRQLERFWTSTDSELLRSAAESDHWSHAMKRAAHLRRRLLLGAALRQPVNMFRAAASAGHGSRRQPYGIHAVFLGPDGVGKSTLIDALSSEIRPLFSGAVVLPSAPAALPGSGRGRPLNQPHALPERPAYQSFAKAIFWLGYYWFEHLWFVRRALRDDKLVISHRSLVDALVDARRYRYGGPPWLLRGILRVLPGPDLVLVLDA